MIISFKTFFKIFEIFLLILAFQPFLTEMLKDMGSEPDPGDQTGSGSESGSVTLLFRQIDSEGANRKEEKISQYNLFLGP